MTPSAKDVATGGDVPTAGAVCKAESYKRPRRQAPRRPTRHRWRQKRRSPPPMTMRFAYVAMRGEMLTAGPASRSAAAPAENEQQQQSGRPGTARFVFGL